MNENNIISCFWDKDSTGCTLGVGGVGLTGLETADMQMMQTYLDASWDLTTTWRICDGINYPRLQWEPIITGDIACPEGVELNDLMALADEWLSLSPNLADIAPVGNPDGQVNLLDFAELANHWMMDLD